MTPVAELLKTAVVIPTMPVAYDSSTAVTPLKLILVSVKPGNTPQEGIAQIGVFRESPQTFQAGALLGNGARIAEIYSNFVILERDGRSERLYLQNSLAAKVSAATPLSTISAGNTAVAPGPDQSRETLTDYIRPSPRFDDGNLIGYQVYPGARAMPFFQIGLQSGDVIVQIDGVSLTDPASAAAALSELVNGATLSVLVRRKDGVQSLTLDGSAFVRAEESLTRIPNPILHAETSR